MASPITDWYRRSASSFLGELKRRQVIKVGVVYVVVGLGVAEAADVFLGNLAPQWALDMALVFLLLGLPVSLLLAWLYDLTPRGVVRDLPDVSTGRSSDPEDVGSTNAGTSAVLPVRDRRSIAVLPFTNRSSDPENEFFADGITDDILTALTLVEGLRVTSRTSAMRYRGSDKDTRTIAAELGVGTVLEGSVRRTNGRVRIVAQLVDANTDAHLWADTYDREVRDALAVQSDVADSVARALRSRLSPHGRARLSAIPTKNVHAYELVARARHAYLKVTQDHIDHGMNLLRQAVDLDPGYAEAWAHLAIAHFVLPYHSTVSPSSIEASARDAIDRALELDQSLPEAYVARAFWRFNFRFDWAGAERDFARALELNPSSADAYQWRSLTHLVGGRFAEAVADARRGVALDPLSFQTRSQLAQNLTWAGHPQEARAILQEVILEDPTNFVAHWALGVVDRPTDPSSALARFEDALSHADVPLAHASRSITLRVLGRTDEADQVIRELEARAAGTAYVSPFALAVAYGGRGEVEKTLDRLEEGVRNHDFMTLHMQLIAEGFGLANHPRYRALVRDVWPDQVTPGR